MGEAGRNEDFRRNLDDALRGTKSLYAEIGPGLRVNAACKGLKTSDGKPPTECPKCGTSHKFAACPVCGCPRSKKR